MGRQRPHGEEEGPASLGALADERLRDARIDVGLVVRSGDTVVPQGAVVVHAVAVHVYSV